MNIVLHNWVKGQIKPYRVKAHIGEPHDVDLSLFHLQTNFKLGHQRSSEQMSLKVRSGHKGQVTANLC